MSKPFYKGRLSINKEKSSPYWMVTFQGPDGKMKRRSTKVPVNGGEFEGDRITAKLAEQGLTTGQTAPQESHFA